MSAWGGNNNQGPWDRPSGGGGQKKPFGNRPQPTPEGPDLEEALRRSREQFRKIFGGGNGDENGEGGKRGLALFFTALFLLWMGSGIYFVKADEQAVVMRFGQFHRTTPPGIGYHLPYPVESVVLPKVTAVNRTEIGFRSASGRGRDGASIPEESLMLTGDENIVDINFEVQWKISKAEEFLFNVRNPEETVKAVAESAMREVIGKSEIASVLAEGKLLVEISTRELIQQTLDNYKAGVEVVSVNLMKVDPPLEVIDAFRDVQTARADLETARNQAEAYRNDILPRARGEAEKLVLDAEAYKQETVARARGEAARFAAVYDQYRQSKDATKKRMYLETMEQIMQGMQKVIVPQGGPGTIPYMALPSIKSPKEQP